MQTVVSILFILFFVFVFLTKSQRQGRKRNTLPALRELDNVIRRDPLTKREREMYLALTSALPECVVLAQVALSALITSTSRTPRNRFDRKVADFVICSGLLTVVTVIELDDASHDDKKANDEDRDAMLKNAGNTTIRYRNVPSENVIRNDITALLTIKTASAHSGMR